MKTKTLYHFLTPTVVLLVSGSLVLAQQPTAQERVAALKASLAASQAILKQYEWVETTVVSLKGEEKSRLLNRCYHGADGKVQKVPVTTPPVVAPDRIFLRVIECFFMATSLSCGSPATACGPWSATRRPP